MHIQLAAYRFKPALIPTLLCLVMFCILVSLGRWQWQRADYKEALRMRHAEGEQAKALGVREASVLGRDVQSFPVELEGRFDNAHTILLDNQVENGTPGFHVLTPMVTGQQQGVLVNRGWLALGNRRDFPAIPALPAQPMRIEGKIYFPSDKQFVLKEDDLSHVQWPLLVQKLDMPALRAVFVKELPGVELAPFVVRLNPGFPAESGEQMIRNWQFMVMSPEKSRGYSLQWYGMAVVLFILYIRFSTEKVRSDD